MKIFLSALIFIFSLSNLYAQDTSNDFIVLMDKDWEPTKNQKRALYFIHIYKHNDSCWNHEFYNLTGPLIKVEAYRDKEGTEPNGQFYYYGEKGLLDSGGIVSNGRKDRDWFYHMGDQTKYETYEKGKLVSSEIKKRTFAVPRDTTLTKKPANIGEVESEFIGGLGSWGRFLRKNLQYPRRAIDLVKDGTVWVQFIIDTEGNVTDVALAKSVEFSLDTEAIRMIKLSEKWTPGSKNGVPVKTYKIQPIEFKLE